MFSDETRAAAKDPWLTLSFICAVLDSPTDVLTEIIVFSFNLYNIRYDFASIFAFLLRVFMQSSSDSLSNKHRFCSDAAKKSDFHNSWPGLDFLDWLVLLDLSGLLGLAGLLDLTGTSWQLMEHT